MLGRLSPVGDRHRPSFADARVSHVNQLFESGIRSENTLIFGRFPQLAMISLDRIGGVDYLADLFYLDVVIPPVAVGQPAGRSKPLGAYFAVEVKYA